MYEQILKEMREKVRTRQYIMTLHAEDEMEDGKLACVVGRLSVTGKLVIITVFRGISGEKL